MNVWIQAARLRTLPAALAPVLIGAALAAADGALHAPAALAALAGALLIQVGTNYANDYFDFVNGADNERRVGPTRATAAGLVPPAAMKRAFILTFLLLIPVAGYLALRGGWPIAIVGVLSVLSGILYTGGPAPLGYLGLGDLFVLVFFGPVAVGGTYYVQAQHLPPHVLLAGLAPGLLSTAILVVNNLRDIDTDREAGKRTLAVRFGARFARIEYTLSLLFAMLIPLILAVSRPAHWPAVAASLALLPALPLIRAVWRDRGAALDVNLGRTGKVLVLYSAIFSAGWLL